MALQNTPMPLYGVKTAGFRDAMALYGAKSLGAAKDVGRFLFSHHPTPMWNRVEHNLPVSGSNYGALGRGYDWAERLLRKPGAIIHPTNTGPHTPIHFDSAANAWRSIPESGYGPGITELGGRIAESVRNGEGRTALRHVGMHLGNTAKTVAHGVGDFARDQVFGSPVDLYQQLSHGGDLARSIPQHIKNFYFPEGSGIGHKVNLGMNLAFPALNLYQGLSQGGPENRGRVIGSTAASLAASPFTLRLGIPGMAAQGLAAEAGGRLGGLFDPKPAADSPELHITAQSRAPTYSFDQPPETSASTATPGAP